MSISEVETIPLATEVATSEDELTVSLADGRRLSVPLAWFPRLLNATNDERAEFRLIGGGEGIHWPRIDEDISVAGLLRGARPRMSAPRSSEHDISSTVEYRRSEHGVTWHWCSNCSSYPSKDYFVRRSRPLEMLCNECAEKARAAQC